MSLDANALSVCSQDWEWRAIKLDDQESKKIIKLDWRI